MSNGVETMIHYKFTLSQNKYLKILKKNANLKYSRKISKKVLSLPIHPFLKKMRYQNY